MDAVVVTSCKAGETRQGEWYYRPGWVELEKNVQTAMAALTEPDHTMITFLPETISEDTNKYRRKAEQSKRTVKAQFKWELPAASGTEPPEGSNERLLDHHLHGTNVHIFPPDQMTSKEAEGEAGASVTLTLNCTLKFDFAPSTGSE